VTVFTASRRKSRAIASQPLELLTIALAPDADSKVEAEKKPRAKRQWVLHRLRKEPSHIMAMRCQVGQEAYERLLDSVCQLRH
jgi:hypothetical protein